MINVIFQFLNRQKKGHLSMKLVPLGKFTRIKDAVWMLVKSITLLNYIFKLKNIAPTYGR